MIRRQFGYEPSAYFEVDTRERERLYIVAMRCASTLISLAICAVTVWGLSSVGMMA